MKKLILTAVLSAATVAAFGQGTIDVGNLLKNTFIQPIFLPNPAAPTVEQVGSPSSTSYTGALPTGTTVYGGAPVTGTGYDMVFLYSLNTSATSYSQMSVGTVVPFRTSATANSSPAGGMSYISTYGVPGTTGGTPFAFEYAAFSTENGTITTWAQALANFNTGSDANAQIGYGQIVDVAALNGSDTANNPHAGATTLAGWTSFSLMSPGVTPEPSTFVLAGLGGAALLLFRRKK